MCAFSSLQFYRTCQLAHHHLIYTLDISSTVSIPCCPSVATPTSHRSPPSPALGHHWFILYSYNFVISRILYKWSQAVRDLSELMFLSVILWQFIQVVCIDSWFLSSVPWCGCTTVHLTLHSLMDKWLISSINKWLISSVYTITDKTAMTIHMQVFS